MERLFVLVLTVVTLVTATPHGYGVKGGASAKAEARAVAGAFGDLGPLPLSIPSGAAYSGSFSKSSASSFASSSASSSSSSYSFSGSGANGIGAIGSDKGCSSGTCPGAGATGLSLNGGDQFAGANAAAAAQAKAQSGSYSPCQGSNCNSSPAEKCTSGQCVTDSVKTGQNGCTGNCDKSPSGEAETPDENSSNKGEKDKQDGDSSDSDDFAVNLNRNPQSKLSHDSNGQYFNKEKPYNSGPGCSNGKCGSNNFDQSSLGNTQSKQPVPATYLTTPNENPPCTTPNCNYGSQNIGPQTGGLPSSYNVPIQSATNPPNTYYSSGSGSGGKQVSYTNSENGVTSGVPCTSPNCNSTPNSGSTSHIPNYNFGQQGPGVQGPCASGQCDTPSSSNGKNSNNGAISGVQTPSYAHANIHSNTPSSYSGQPGCSSPYCAGIPTYSSLPTTQPNSGCSGAACYGNSVTGSTKPGSDAPAYTGGFGGPAGSAVTGSTKPSASDAPVYTGGFGGPAGFLDKPGGSSKLPVNSAYGHNTPGTSGTTGTFGSTIGSFGTTKPNEFHSTNHYGSTQTSGSSGSTGNFQYNKPGSVPSSPGSQFNPAATGSYGAPTGSSSAGPGSIPHPGNSGTYTPITSHTGSNPTYSGGTDSSTGSSHTSSGFDSIHGSFGVTKPNTPSNSLSSPTYNGGFGGPTGTVGGPSASLGTSGSPSKPGSGNCGSAFCQLGANSNGGYDKTKPSTSTSNQNKPAYNGGFGGPNGFLNPNNVDVPSNTPTVTSGNTPCTNGNCGSKDIPSSNQGNSLSGTNNLVSATASANAVAYSGGFGGPPGFLKPYDDGKVPVHGNHASGHSPASNAGQLNNPLSNGKSPEPGSSGSGANAAAQSSASASATAGSYGGGNNNQRSNGASRGCNSGCSPNGADDNFGFPAGHTNNGLGASSQASAKSSAGVNAYGLGGSFASSSASAHASAGAATKGGYGRK